RCCHPQCGAVEECR
nr:Chain E, MP-21HQQ_F Chain F, MP-21HQQ_G Chain G, MP-21HQQ_H Chain H, MP-2